VEEDFVNSITTGAPVRLTSFEDGVRYMAVVDRAYEAWLSTTEQGI
jgi:predicted dehydrogenase